MSGPRRLPAALVAALACLALAFAGCGGGSTARDNAYVAKVNQAQNAFARKVKRLSGRVTDRSTPREDEATLRSFTAAVDQVVVRLRRIDPPQSVAGLHAALVRDMGAYADEVRSAAASLRSKTADPLRSQQRLLKATSTVNAQINHTIHAINQKLGAA